MNVKTNLEPIGTFDVTNTLTFIPTQPTSELTPQHLLLASNDHPQKFYLFPEEGSWCVGINFSARINTEFSSC